MRLDDLARPFRIEQVGKARRRHLALDEVGVVGDRAQAHAEACEHSVGILVLGGIMLGDVRRHEGSQKAVALPHDEMGSVRRIDHVDPVDAARIFLADALEHALGAAALDAHGDTGKRCLERSRDLLGQRQIDRGIVVDLSFLPRRLDQLRRDRGRFGCCAARRRGKQTDGGDRGGLEHVAPGEPTLRHCFLLVQRGPFCRPWCSARAGLSG